MGKGADAQEVGARGGCWEALVGMERRRCSGRSYSGTCEHPQWRKESLGKALCPICGHFGKKNNPIFLHDKRSLDTRVKNSAQTIGGKIMGILGYFFLFL